MKHDMAIFLGKAAMFFMLFCTIGSLMWFGTSELWYSKIMALGITYVFVIQAYNEYQNYKEVETWN